MANEFVPAPDRVLGVHSADAVNVLVTPPGLTGAEIAMRIRRGFLGHVATWRTGEAPERWQIDASITEWKGDSPSLDYVTTRI